MSRSPSPDPRSPAMSTEDKLLKYIQMCYPDCPRVKFASSRHIILDQYNHILKVCTGTLLGGTGIPMNEVVCGVILCKLYKYRRALPTNEEGGYEEYGPQHVGFIQGASELVFEFAETQPNSGIPPLPHTDASDVEDVMMKRKHIHESIYAHTRTLWRAASRRFEAGLKLCREEKLKAIQQQMMMRALLSFGKQWARVVERSGHHHQPVKPPVQEVNCSTSNAHYPVPIFYWDMAERYFVSMIDDGVSTKSHIDLQLKSKSVAIAGYNYIRDLYAGRRLGSTSILMDDYLCSFILGRLYRRRGCFTWLGWGDTDFLNLASRDVFEHVEHVPESGIPPYFSTDPNYNPSDAANTRIEIQQSINYFVRLMWTKVTVHTRASWAEEMSDAHTAKLFKADRIKNQKCTKVRVPRCEMVLYSIGGKRVRGYSEE